MSLPVILILAPPDDAHAQVVQRRIEQLFPAVRPIILPTGEFPQKIRLIVLFGAEKNLVTIVLPDQDALSAERIRTIWYRRSQIPQIASTVDDPESRRFALVESFHALKGLWLSLNCFWVNHPRRDREAAKKVYQLKLAQQLGFRIPQTLITNHPPTVREFWEAHGGKIIYKKLQGLQGKGWRTEFLGQTELAMLEAITLAPVIFQEFIPAAYDLRITVIGDDIFPVRIASQQSLSPLDWRQDYGVLMEKCALPDEITTKIRALMNRLQLVYGAIDMRVTPEGEYVFFEINPSGQFLFVEVATGLPLSETFARLLVNGQQ